MLSLIFCVNFLSHSLESALLVYGPKTPTGLISNFNNTLSLFLSSNSNYLKLPEMNFLSYILDISLDPNLLPILDSISSTLKVPYLTLTKTSDFEYSSQRFSILPPYRLEAKALISLIRFFGWKKFSVLSSSSEENLKIIDMISSSLIDCQMKSIIYEKNITEKSLDMMIKRLIKAANVKNVVVLDQGESLEICLGLLKLRKLDQFGNYFLLGTGNFYPGIEGSVEIAYEVGNDAISIEQFYITAINYIINKLTTFTFQDFNRICNQGICLQEFFVFNVRDGKKGC
jgi:hypothetical protein